MLTKASIATLFFSPNLHLFLLSSFSRLSNVSIFSLKQKANQILPAAVKKIKFCTETQPHVPLVYNFQFWVNLEISSPAFK